MTSEVTNVSIAAWQHSLSSHRGLGNTA